MADASSDQLWLIFDSELSFTKDRLLSQNSLRVASADFCRNVVPPNGPERLDSDLL